MPIYAYRCSTCGHAKDVLQKISDPLLTICPACGADAFRKQVTAAGFQLKGSGWYVTDFKGGDKKPAKPAAEGANAAGAAAPSSDAPKADAGKSETKTESKSDSGSSTSTTSAPAPSPTPTSGSSQ